MSRKYIFVTGGVVSGIGKGITAASIGRLLKARGYRVTMQKFDPYINIDPGTMSPYQHGEVFVTDDGSETDLDLGHYERFIDENLNAYCNLTTGKIYWSVITRERVGEYLGGTVQVIPHITNEIKAAINKVGRAENTDIVITEIGGTVGDIESLPFLEAIRQVAVDAGRGNCIFVHVTLVPYIETSGEQKSKPTQHSVKELLSLGIQPDIIVCRTALRMPQDLRDKLALFCNVSPDCIIENMDAFSLYEVPLMLEKEGLANVIIDHLHLDAAEPNLADWESLVQRQKQAKESITVALVGKYVSLRDAYLSIAEALTHAAIAHNYNVKIDWIDSDSLTADDAGEKLRDADAILVPGAFGDRDVDGKMHAIRYAREHNVPFLGICLGMQLAVVEFARNVLGLKDAHSPELSPDTPYPVIDLLPGHTHDEDKGGTMRLGKYPCTLAKDSLAYKAYQEEQIEERHRHRYEFNNEYREAMIEKGMRFPGLSPDGTLVEVIEIPSLDWFVAVQYHPEFKSRPNRAHPLFRDFIGAAIKKTNK